MFIKLVTQAGIAPAVASLCFHRLSGLTDLKSDVGPLTLYFSSGPRCIKGFGFQRPRVTVHAAESKIGAQ